MGRRGNCWISARRQTLLVAETGSRQARDGEGLRETWSRRAELTISLRLLDCRRAGGNWHARSGRLELNDGRRHLGKSRQSSVRAVLDSGCGRATSLSGGLGWWFGGEGKLEEGERGPSDGFDQTFFAQVGPGWTAVDRGGPGVGRGGLGSIHDWSQIGGALCSRHPAASAAAGGTLSSGSWRPCIGTTQRRPPTTFQCTSGWLGWLG